MALTTDPDTQRDVDLARSNAYVVCARPAHQQSRLSEQRADAITHRT